MNQAEFEARYGRVPSSSQANKHSEGLSIARTIRRAVTGGGNRARDGCQAPSPSLTTRLLRMVPILQWLPRYSLKENLHADVVTGLTVGIMVVPQGMAYASLAGLEPIYGLYSCFFPALTYMFFGTSRHVSIGTFAVASMMVGAVKAEFMALENDLAHPHNSSRVGADYDFTALELTR